jgi:hypothetical protein
VILYRSLQYPTTPTIITSLSLSSVFDHSYHHHITPITITSLTHNFTNPSLSSVFDYYHHYHVTCFTVVPILQSLHSLITFFTIASLSAGCRTLLVERTGLADVAFATASLGATHGFDSVRFVPPPPVPSRFRVYVRSFPRYSFFLNHSLLFFHQ